MKKDKEILSLLKHIGNHKKLLLDKLSIAEDNADVEMFEFITKLVDQQTQAIQDCLEIIKQNNNGQWRSVLSKTKMPGRTKNFE